MITALSDATQPIMVHSSNQRHMGTLGSNGENFSIHPNFCAALRKMNRRVLQGDGSA